MSTIEKLEKRLEKEPSSLLFVQLVEEYRKAGRIDDAIRLCQRGIDYHPNYASAYIALAKCYYEKGELEKSKENLERALSSMPDNIQAVLLLVDVDEKLGYLDKALENLKLVQLLAPSDKIDEHVRLLEKKLRLGDESPTIHFSVSLIKESLPSEEPMTVHMPREVLEKEIAAMNNTGKIESSDLEQVIGANKEKEIQEIDQEKIPKEEVTETIETEKKQEEFEDFDTRKYTNLDETIETSEGEPVEILSLIKPDVLSANEVNKKQQPAEESREEINGEAQEITTQTLGEIYAAQGHFDKAIKIYQKIVLVEPDNSTAINRLKQLIDEFNRVNAQANIQFFKEEISAEESDTSKISTKGMERKKRISTLENWLLTVRKEKDTKIK